MTGIVILAAGGSSRLGQPKQNLIFKGKSLLQNTISEAAKAKIGPVALVLGADFKNISKVINKNLVHILNNAEWNEGISSSIRCGLMHLMKTENDLKNVLFLLCDQPFVNSELITNILKEKDHSGKRIVASFYNNTLGVPALFEDIYFPELLFLTGNEGAKKIIYKHRHEVAAVPFPEGAIDIDTQDDFDKLLGASNEINENSINTSTP
jgi:molybdenum cofactor cytidylyltransferase